MIPVCPICGETMTKSGIKHTMLYYCPRESATHAIYHLDSDKITFQVITILPYEFVIHDGAVKRTEVCLISRDERGRLGNHKTILRIDTPMNLSWHDKEEVLRKLKLYILFS